MLGIIRNCGIYNWRDTFLRLLPHDLLLTITAGYFGVKNFKIKKIGDVPWSACFVHVGTDLIVVFSLGYLTTNWVVRYWNARYR